MAKCLPEFGHNYNQVSREVMYNWFNKHLKLGLAEPVAGTAVRAGDIHASCPSTIRTIRTRRIRVDAARLRKAMTRTKSDKQIAALQPKDAKSLAEYRRVFGHGAAGDGQRLSCRRLPTWWRRNRARRKSATASPCVVSCWAAREQGEQVPCIGVLGNDFDGNVVVWIHPAGKRSLWQDGKLVPAARQIIDSKAAILAVDVFGTGELTPDKPMAVNADFAGFTFGYNRPLLAQRVHDILTAVAFAHGHDKTKAVHLVGWDKAGPWVLLARGLCGEAVSRTSADAAKLRFGSIQKRATR